MKICKQSCLALCQLRSIGHLGAGVVPEGRARRAAVLIKIRPSCLRIMETSLYYIPALSFFESISGRTQARKTPKSFERSVPGSASACAFFTLPPIFIILTAWSPDERPLNNIEPLKLNDESIDGASWAFVGVNITGQ